jgi:hypothetical protein
MLRTTLAFLLVVVIAAPGLAGSPLASSAVRKDPADEFRCLVTNVSSTQTLEYQVAAYSFDGTAVLGPIASGLAPLSSTAWPVAAATVQLHCQLTVTKGSKKNARLATVVLSGVTEVTRSEGH